MFDVLIVGAGPAGSTCGRYLSRLGFSVGLVDKFEFPRDKPCGGGLSPKIIREFPFLQRRTSEFLESIAHVAVLHSPNRQVVISRKIDLAMTLRTRFDNVLFQSAIESGATPLTDKRVKAINVEEGQIEIQFSGGESARTRFLVGADGVNSFVARMTGLHSKWPSTSVTACRVIEIPMKENKITDLYTEDREYHFFANVGREPGYGWIFPKRTTVNVGLGIVGNYARGLPQKFLRFIGLLMQEGLLPKGIDTSRARGALVPTGGAIKRSYSNRLLLVGDSAGMVNPLTGGGISYAMRAAKYAAKVIASAFENERFDEKFLAKYQVLWWHDFGKDMRSMLIGQKIFTSPFTDTLFEIGKRDKQIQQIVTEKLAGHSHSGNIGTQLFMRVAQACLREAFHLS